MKQQLQTRLVGLRREVEGVTVETTRLGSCEGESRVLIIRGKKRAGFEYTFDLHWRCETICFRSSECARA
jgi:hypothetical protein